MDVKICPGPAGRAAIWKSNQRASGAQGSGGRRPPEQGVVERPANNNTRVRNVCLTARQGRQHGHQQFRQNIRDGKTHVANLTVFDGEPLVVQVNLAALFIGYGRAGMPLVGVVVVQKDAVHRLHQKRSGKQKSQRQSGPASGNGAVYHERASTCRGQN